MKTTSILCMVAVLSACSASVTPGLEAGIKAVPQPQGPVSITAGSLLATEESETQTKGFRTAEGRYMELQRGLLNLVPVELVRCASVWQPLNPLANAYAHGGHDGAAPAGVVDVNHADGTEFDLGALAPAPGTYCGLRLQLLPVTDALPDSNINMLGASAYVAPCTYRDTPLPNPGLPLDPAALAEEGCLEGVKLLDAGAPFTVEINPSLTTGVRGGSLMIAIAYDRWFDGVDVAALETSAEDQARVLANIRASMTVIGE